MEEIFENEINLENDDNVPNELSNEKSETETIELKSKKKSYYKFFISNKGIAFLGTIIGACTVFFLYQQNKLFETQNNLFKIQNKRIQQQTHLIEASRRSSQVFIMGDVLSDINKELTNKDNIKDTLSYPLTGRIISLSRAMKPYKYFENDTLILRALSPERGQLLISLIESKIKNDFFIKNIMTKSEFNFADLRNANLSNLNLSGIRLMEANMQNCQLYKTSFTNSNLWGSIFQGSNMQNSDLRNVDLRNTNMKNVELLNANLKYTLLNNSDLTGSDLRGVQLFKTNLNNAKLDSVKVDENWLNKINDGKLEIRGVEYINQTYEIHNIFYPSRNFSIPTLIKK